MLRRRILPTASAHIRILVWLAQLVIMVDRKRRNILVVLLRRLVTGQVTNDQFEEDLAKLFQGTDCEFRHDRALCGVAEQSWFLYSDNEEHTLRLKKKSRRRQQRREVARWIMFLHTDLEYEWPDVDMIPKPLPWLLTLGIPHRRRMRRFEKAGDWGVWPFIRKSDYDKALSTPKLLAGVARSSRMTN